MKTKIKDLTVKDLNVIVSKVYEKSIFEKSLVGLALDFLNQILNINVMQSPFNEIRNSYIESSEDKEAPENEFQFFPYICLKYLHLKEAPRDKLLMLHMQASKDLREIDKNLGYISKERDKLNNISKKHKFLNSEERYYRNQLDFYKDKNEKAREEIVDFITHCFENMALSMCHSLGSNLSLRASSVVVMPYPFGTHSVLNNQYSLYDPRNLDELSCKFLDLAVGSHSDIRKLYSEDKEQFYDFATSYIDGDSGVDTGLTKVREFIDSNHILNRRRQVLEVIFQHYNNGDFISVVNMLPLQIEGIFHDICLAFNIKESELEIASLNEKLRKLDANYRYFIYFEYFSFKFPPLRNKVAHGQLIDDDLKHSAIMLILDLIPVCSLACSDEIPVNKKLKLIKQSVNKDFASLIELFYLDEIELPDLYDLSEEYTLSTKLYDSEEFWDYIRHEVEEERLENINKCNVVKFVRKLNNSKYTNAKCEQFLKVELSAIAKRKKTKQAEFRALLDRIRPKN